MGLNNIHKLKKIILENKIVENKVLSDLLGVSPMSITRYLKELEKEGFIERTHGGAVLIEDKKNLLDIDFNKRKDIETKKKILISKTAASHVVSNDKIFIDSGSTTMYLLDYLVKDITIYTNSVHIALAAIEKKFMKVNMVGGSIKPLTLATTDLYEVSLFEKMNFDHCFIGSNSFDSFGSLTTPDEKEGRVKELFSSLSINVWVLIDSTKYDKETFYNFTPDKFTIVTDYKGEILSEKHDVKKLEVKDGNI